VIGIARALSTDTQCEHVESGSPIGQPSSEHPEGVGAVVTCLLLILDAFLNLIWFLLGEPQRSLQGFVDGIVCLLPYGLLLGLGAFLFHKSKLSRQIVGAYLLTSCAMVAWAAASESGESYGVLLALERGIVRWGFLLEGVCLARALAISVKGSRGGHTWIWAALLSVASAMAAVGVSYLLQAWHYNRWRASPSGIYQILLPRGDTESLLLAHVVWIPVLVPLGVAIAWLWGMPLSMPIDIRFRRRKCERDANSSRGTTCSP